MAVVTNNYEEPELDLSMNPEFTKLKEEEKVALAAGLANTTNIKVCINNERGQVNLK